MKYRIELFRSIEQTVDNNAYELPIGFVIVEGDEVGAEALGAAMYQNSAADYLSFD
jgi:hypothetical protein